MTTTTIPIPKGTIFLCDAIPHLPVNCIFNKGATGCGGTTIALVNHTPTVVCVPYRALVDNKVVQSTRNNTLYPYEIFGVHGDVTNANLSHYISRAVVPKILVTYDSLKRVMELINPSNFHIVIDEYHCLFTQYSFRANAAMTVLENYKSFGSFTFMTATPIEEEFKLDELKDIDVVEAKWEDSLPVLVHVVKNKNGVEKTIKHQISRILRGDFEGNYYFFVNSVKFIKKMIDNCSLTNLNCRVIYSNSNDTKLGVARGRSTDEPKKINFITSSAFEGVDFYDEDGKIVIVSDGNRSNTLIDISTQFLQIAGRIRNSKYRGHIWHVLSHTRYSGKLSYTEFRKMVHADIKKEQEIVAQLDHMQDLDVKMNCALKMDFKFYRVDEMTRSIQQNLNASKIDLYNYQILNSDYHSMTNLAGKYAKNKLQVIWGYTASNPELIPMDDVTTLKQTVEELKRLNDFRPGLFSNYNYESYKAASISKFDFLNEALTVLGFEGMASLKYHTANIKRKIIQLTPKTSETSDLGRVSEMLHLSKTFSKGKVVTRAEIKLLLNSCYSDLGIAKKGTSKDIETYYHVKVVTRVIQGKQQRALGIGSRKITKLL